MGRTKDLNVIRKLGINEAYQLAMYQLDQYRGTILSCRYTIPPPFVPAESRMKLEQAVKFAVDRIIKKHPMLQVGIRDGKTPAWIKQDSLDLTRHINWLYVGEQDDFEQVVQKTFSTQIDERFPDIAHPGWKMTFLRQEYAPFMEVLLTWNHPQFDGAGARVIHEDFLEMLNTGHQAHECLSYDNDILVLPHSLAPSLPPPIESSRNLPVNTRFFAKVLWDEFQPDFLHRRDVSFAAWCPIRSSPYGTQSRAFYIDEAPLQKIRTLCREKKTTITGLIHGLATIAFSLHLDSSTATAFQSSTVIDHRRNLPEAPPNVPWGQSERVVGNYVTQAFHKFQPDVVAQIRSILSVNNEKETRDLPKDLIEKLWDISAQSRKEIVSRLEAGLQNDLVGVFKYVTDWQKTMEGMAKRTRQFSWLVSNIGVMAANTAFEEGAPGDDCRWSISRARFGLSAETPTAAMVFSPVSVVGRGMCVDVSWSDCAVESSFAERIAGSMQRWLAQLANL